jgi:hypothetical protein
VDAGDSTTFWAKLLALDEFLNGWVNDHHVNHDGGVKQHQQDQ